MDDAAVATTKLLLNCYSRWSQWVCMIICMNKCAAFGTKKFSKSSLQFQPRLLINSEATPSVKQGESFRYLVHFFDYDMNNKEHKDLALSNFQTMLKTIDTLNILPKTNYFYMIDVFLSKISWHLTVTDLGKACIFENLDKVVTNYAL